MVSDRQFDPLIEHVIQTGKRAGAHALSTAIYYRHQRVLHFWEGKETLNEEKTLSEHSRFNVYSVRKSMIGYAIAALMESAMIESVDVPIVALFDHPHPEKLKAITLRHLLTHTHGLDGDPMNPRKRFVPGTRWHYTNTGIVLLNRIFENITKESVASFVKEKVWLPLGMKDTSFCTDEESHLVHDVSIFHHELPLVLGSSLGDERNLYMSSHDLAIWGNYHLQDNPIAHRAMTMLTPQTLDRRYPRHAYGWWYKEGHSRLCEIGDLVPDGSVQIMGMSGCLVLVIPSWQVVAVRMMNSLGGRFSFVRDAKRFGDLVMTCLMRG